MFCGNTSTSAIELERHFDLGFENTSRPLKNDLYFDCTTRVVAFAKTRVN